MTPEKKIHSLKTAVIVMSIILVGCFVYIFQFANDTKTLVTTVKKVKSQQQIALEKLEKLKAQYDEAIAKKTALSAELIIERDKVESLINLVKTSNGDPKILASITDQSNQLENASKDLISKNETFFAAQSNPENIKIRIDSVVTIKNQIVQTNKQLTTQFKDLKKSMVTASKISVVGLSARTFKVKDSGREVETDNAGKVEEIKVAFSVPENVLATKEPKIFYVQIIDSKLNVVGENKIMMFGENKLVYSFEKNIDYQNKTVDVVENFMVENLAEGEYFLNVFLKDQLVNKTSFTLK